MLPRQFALGVGRERTKDGWDGREGEGEGRGVRECEEKNIVEPIKFLKVIHGCGYGEAQGFIIQEPPAQFKAPQHQITGYGSESSR